MNPSFRTPSAARSTLLLALAAISSACGDEATYVDDPEPSSGGGAGLAGAPAWSGSGAFTGSGGAPSGGAPNGTSGARSPGGAASGGSNASGGPSAGGASGGGAASSGGAPSDTGGGPGATGGAPDGSGGATPSAGGAVGSGGAAPGGCPTGLVGWAAESGDGVTTTTGGGTAAPVRPQSAAELMAYAEDASPRVIEIAGTFAVPRLQVNSNKTLVGIGSDATLNGGVRIRGSDGALVSNVIVQNLRLNGATTEVDNDAMQIYFAHHVWIDHVEIWDGRDGNLDMTHAVNWVTVSWTKFRYTSNYTRPAGESADHRFSSLLGHSDDNADEDTGRIKVTFHHDWWAEGVIERMPRVRFGQVHVFNNYYSSPGNNYCVRAGTHAALLVEGNYFDHVNSPHQFNSEDDEKTANITQRSNEYDGATGDRAEGGGGPAFTQAPYAATIEAASSVPAVVRACAGPR